MRITVITPVFNDPRVEAAAASVRVQRSQADVEHIVIDGGSTDTPTRAALDASALAGARVISEPDRGLYDAMNKGVRMATGDVVGILNADDVYARDDVLELVRLAMLDPAVDGCYGDLVMVDAEGAPRRIWRAGRGSWRLGWMPPHPTVFLRRSLYEAHGGFREDLPIAADYELMLRFCLKHNAQLQYVPHVLVRFSLGGISTGGLRAVQRGNAQVLRAWRMNGLRGGGLVPILKPFRKIIQYPAAKFSFHGASHS